MVSILVATYNQEAFIGRTLESLLDQDCPFAYEILVGEDCSTDKTRSICRDYATRYPETIRLFLHETNKGLIKNYFDLLSHAKGTYLADCGGDDYWIAKDKLRRQVAFLEAHPDITLVGANWQWLDASNGNTNPNQLHLDSDWHQPYRFGKQAISDYLNRNQFPHVVLSTACFRTATVKRIMENHPDRFTGKGVICEDLPITLSLLNEGPFYLFKEDVMVYRVLPRSMSHTDSKFDLQKGFSNHVFWQTIQLAAEFGIGPKELEPFLKRNIPDMFYTGWMTNDPDWMESQHKRLISHGIRLTMKQHLILFLLKLPWKPWLTQKN